MDRREFLRASGMAALSLFAPSVTAWALDGQQDIEGNKLIVVFLRGAVDGLNVVVPYSDSRYYSVRNKIAIPKPGQEGGALDLDGHFGLHPKLEPLMPLWRNKSLSFVLCSGSPDPTRSHFDAQDYMESGAPGNKTMGSGWMNRLLMQLPNNKSPIRAINIGSVTPRVMQGPVSVASYAPSNKKRTTAVDKPRVLSAFEQMYGGRTDALGVAFAEGVEARKTLNSKLEDEMLAANQGAPNAAKFGNFGRQLGKLIKEEPKVQAAFVALGGYDTHVNQGASQGQLANHLTPIGNGLSQLIEALGPAYQKTVIIVMSEFGRTVKENGNGGTDHGHGNAMWLLGGPIAGGKILGRWDGLSERALYEGRDLPVTTDFRSVITAVIRDHLSLDKAKLNAIFPDFQAADPLLKDVMRA